VKVGFWEEILTVDDSGAARIRDGDQAASPGGLFFKKK
jgi:hypothetical protein